MTYIIAALFTSGLAFTFYVMLVLTEREERMEDRVRANAARRRLRDLSPTNGLDL